jgi:hypothetical protein
LSARRPLTLALVALTALPGLVAAQSLAELAAREREKKKGQKPTAKVITDDDLRRGTAGRGTVNSGANEPAAAPTATASPVAPAAPGTEKPKTEEELRAEQEQAWRDKLKKGQAEVQRVAQALEVVNRHLGDMSGNLYSAQRNALLAEAEKLKAEQQTAQQLVAALEEEGRRSRFRP